MFTDRNGDMRRRNGETEHVGCMLNKCINNSLKGNMMYIQKQTMAHTVEKIQEILASF